jgi:hypothetical protein
MLTRPRTGLRRKKQRLASQKSNRTEWALVEDFFKKKDCEDKKMLTEE